MESSRSEEIVNKVLDGLRDTRAPEGMEHRILQTLAASNVSLPPITTKPWRPAKWVLASVLAAAAVLVAVLMPVLFRRHEPPRVLPARNIAPASVAPLPPAVHAADTRSVEPVQPVRGIKNTVTRKTLAASVAAPSEESLSMERMRAPSLPAPPIPLTAQERALQRVAREHDPAVLTAFDNDVQAQNDARLEAEFREFFKSPYGPAKTQDDVSPKTETEEPPKTEVAKPVTAKTA